LGSTLDRLRPFAEEPARQPMSRTVQFPTPATRVLSLEQDLARLREALRQAIAIADLLIDNARLAERSGEIPPANPEVIRPR
jgi:hypothetical protein